LQIFLIKMLMKQHFIGWFFPSSLVLFFRRTDFDSMLTRFYFLSLLGKILVKGISKSWLRKLALFLIFGSGPRWKNQSLQNIIKYGFQEGNVTTEIGLAQTFAKDNISCQLSSWMNKKSGSEQSTIWVKWNHISICRRTRSTWSPIQEHTHTQENKN